MRAISLCLFLASCVTSPFDVVSVQDQRAHPSFLPRVEATADGFHAQGLEVPLLCRDTSGEETAFGPCDDVATTLGADFGPANYSCDTAGCHGGREPGSGEVSTSALHGGEGPSCWTCHVNNWDEES
jgi:hypothetical protein